MLSSRIRFAYSECQALFVKFSECIKSHNRPLWGIGTVFGMLKVLGVHSTTLFEVRGAVLFDYRGFRNIHSNFVVRVGVMLF